MLLITIAKTTFPLHRWIDRDPEQGCCFLALQKKGDLSSSVHPFHSRILGSLQPFYLRHGPLSLSRRDSANRFHLSWPVHHCWGFPREEAGESDKQLPCLSRSARMTRGVALLQQRWGWASAELSSGSVTL